MTDYYNEMKRIRIVRTPDKTPIRRIGCPRHSRPGCFHYGWVSGAAHLLLTLACALGGAVPGAQAADKPNIIILYADDVGYGDLGCYGATAVKTPNVDRLAREGLRFTDGYASSATCTPSRFSILTGEYAFRQKGTGVLPGDAALIIRPGSATLPAILQGAGYATAAIGKWHLGLGQKGVPLDWNGEIKPGPLEVGFNYCFIIPATPDRVPCVYVRNHRVFNLDPADPIKVSYEKPFPGERTGREERGSLKMESSQGHSDALINGIGRIGYMVGGKAALWKDDEMEEVLARQAVEFIEREKDRPFFLYYASHDIHVPRVPNKQFVGKTGMGPRGDELAEFDWSVGQILDTLDRLHLAENTLVILSSDNGPVLDDGYKDEANELVGHHRPAGPLRAGKYSLFEGGTRVPFIVRWPRKVKPGVSGALISQVDLAASLASLTGRQLGPKDAPDSFNMLPALIGQSQQGREALVEHAGQLGLREGDWKFIPPGRARDGLGPWTFIRVPQPGLLFQVTTDPGETKDVAAEHPEELRKLKAQLDLIRRNGSAPPRNDSKANPE